MRYSVEQIFIFREGKMILFSLLFRITAEPRGIADADLERLYRILRFTNRNVYAKYNPLTF